MATKTTKRVRCNACRQKFDAPKDAWGFASIYVCPACTAYTHTPEYTAAQGGLFTSSADYADDPEPEPWYTI